MRSFAVKCSLWRTLMPARQLWHPVSASAVMVALPACGVCVRPRVAESVLITLAFRVMVGWGCDLRFIHVFCRLSNRWWSTAICCILCHSCLQGPNFVQFAESSLSCVTYNISSWSVTRAEVWACFDILSFLHTFSKWFDLLHFLQSFP